MTIQNTAENLIKASTPFICELHNDTNQHSQIKNDDSNQAAHSVAIVLINANWEVILKKTPDDKFEVPLQPLKSKSIEKDSIRLASKFTEEKIKQKYIFRIATNNNGNKNTSHIFMAKTTKDTCHLNAYNFSVDEINQKIEAGLISDPTTIISIDKALSALSYSQ